MIPTEELLRLRDAIDAGNAAFYHFDLKDGLLESLQELINIREQLGETPIEGAVESIAELASVLSDSGADDLDGLVTAYQTLKEIKGLL